MPDHFFFRDTTALLFFRTGLIRPGPRRTKIHGQRFSAPGGFDNQNRFLECLVNGDAERVFGANALAVKSVPHLHLAVQNRIPIAAARQVGDPRVVADNWIAVLVQNLTEKRGRFRVVANRRKRALMRRALHIGLSGENVNLQRLGLRRRDIEGKSDDRDDG